MFKSALKFALVAFAVLLANGGLGAPLNNDFTKANKSTDNIKEKRQFHRQDERYESGDKEFEASKYLPPPDRHDLKDKEYGGTPSAVASQMESKRYQSDKTYTPPELQILDRTFYDKDKKADIDDKNLNKDYAGSIDFDKRHPNDAYMKEFLSHMQEKSMQEINKYVFRSSHSSDPGVNTISAGSQLHSDKADSSEIADFLFGTKRISRSPINFRKNKQVGTIADKSLASAPAGSEEPSVSQSAPARLSPNTRILPPIVNGTQNSSTANRPQERKVKVAEKEVDMGKTNLFAPRAQGMSTGKYKIKVEVSDPQ